MPSVLSNFWGGVKESASTEHGVVPEMKALPAKFYHSEAIYQLERRAIFAKKWLCVAHVAIIPERGNWQLYNIAGYQFFIIRDKEDGVRAFHNACRHRGFPLLGAKQDGEPDVSAKVGKSQIMACAYHGWSYSINGDLAKAPGFDNVSGFDKNSHGLLNLRTHVDKNGFIYVNMDKSPEGVSWKDQYGDLEDQPRFAKIDFENYAYYKSWGMQDCQFNWKVLTANYNECHHCTYAHPGFVQTTDLPSYKTVNCQGHIAHYAKAKPGDHKIDTEKFVFNYVFPSGAHTITPLYWYQMRICPTGPRTCDINYDVYRHKDSTEEQFEAQDAFFLQVAVEDKFLCINQQSSLEMGSFHCGPLHPTKEPAVAYFDQQHLKALMEHHDLERKAGREINPALALYGGETTEADLFCRSVESGCGSKDLEW